MTHEVLFARQPIYNRKDAIYAFELLYRGGLLLPLRHKRQVPQQKC
jgi:hypothetical protein